MLLMNYLVHYNAGQHEKSSVLQDFISDSFDIYLPLFYMFFHRCLRIVCDSWRLFVEFSLDGKVISQSSCKKRKVSFDGSNFWVDVTPGPVKNIGILTSLEKECDRDNELACKHYITQPFEGARECLLLLRNSVDSLHKKKLFPYNPEVLLKRWVS